MDLFSKHKMLVILGPTATGKTDLALQLASKFQGELISCDSRQVYRGLDIGTGKISGKDVSETSSEILRYAQNDIKKANRYWIVNGVKVWMYDVVDSRKQYTVARYVKDAREVIGEIRERGKLPVVVGGTGLYLKALLEGLPNLAIPVEPKLRKKLEKLSKLKLQEKLKKVSLKRWEGMNASDRENPRRLIRSIELSLSSLRAQRSNLDIRLPPFDFAQGKPPRNDTLRIGLTAPREVLYKRVDERVIDRIRQGMIEEAKELHKKGLTFKRMRELGLEYGVLADYLAGEVRDIQGSQGLKSVSSQASLIKVMQNKIHGYVRRQLTWFKKEREVHWFNITNKNLPILLERKVSKWYYQI